MYMVAFVVGQKTRIVSIIFVLAMPKPRSNYMTCGSRYLVGVRNGCEEFKGVQQGSL